MGSRCVKMDAANYYVVRKEKLCYALRNTNYVSGIGT